SADREDATKPGLTFIEHALEREGASAKKIHAEMSLAAWRYRPGLLAECGKIMRFLSIVAHDKNRALAPPGRRKYEFRRPSSVGGLKCCHSDSLVGYANVHVHRQSGLGCRGERE